ncbi:MULTISPECIES: hypothetical protein [Streptomyces]|uniref:Uncharacterized protein n=2 Tax=Streptomyces TaxID=1883 RepID=A0ABU4JZ26_9ACTN|nr:hypothetical protein [Streptomyces roseolus]MDX2290751.1 hypothetical protein [Streptomyces roseolus]
MIRAGRAPKARTLTDLAAQQGLSISQYRRLKPYTEEGFPAPVSSPGAQTVLYDADQVDAYLAGRPVPALPDTDSDDDLLDRTEAAAVLGIAPDSWTVYQTRSGLAEHRVDVAGVGHWPRGIVHAYKTERDTRTHGAGGRPARTGTQVPSDQLLPRTAPLLDADPTITAADVTDALGVHRDTAQRALTHLRASRIADLMTADPTLTPEQAAIQLGYPAGQVRTAVRRQALTELRARTATAYLTAVTDALRAAGLTTDTAPVVEQTREDRLRAAVLLAPGAPAPAVVWEEDAGWRTASRRRHPYTAPDSHPLLPGTPQPAPADLLAALTS